MIFNYCKRMLLHAALVAGLAVLVGCGGGGSGGDSGVLGGGVPSGVPTTTSSAVLNPTAPAGQILIGNEFDGPFVLDLRTGNYVELLALDWEERMDRNIFAGLWVRFSDDRQEIIESETSCSLRAGALTRDDCVIFRDSAGRETSRFTIPSGGTSGLGLHPPAQLSPDGQFVAAAVDLELDGLGRLHIYNREGDLLSVSAENQLLSGDQFAWLPDNSLIYASDQTLYLTTPNSAQGSVFVEFPPNAGRPAQLALSPDGTRLAFTLITVPRPFRGSVWIINLDGSAFNRLALTQPEDELRIRFPTWSPDGSQIFLVDGSVPLQFAYIVPADGEDVLLTVDQPTEAIRIESFYNRDVSGFASFTDPEPSFDVFSNGLQWLQ